MLLAWFRFPRCVIALLADSRLSCTPFLRLRTFIRLFTGIQPHVGTLKFQANTSIYYYFVYLRFPIIENPLCALGTLCLYPRARCTHARP
ncbi:hypothetical protein EDB86DRAFT_2897026 [Lactarius hatsudake]|nr:hypothetical protein EDB86DRAFT_2897026 [Lactarius hatsudake]